MRDLHLIEETLQRLKPPTWPQDLFSAIDKPLAAQGRALFAENCAGCHLPTVTQENGRPVQQLKMLPVDYIGTDPGTANNIADQRYDLSALQWDPAELAQLNVELHPTPTAPLDLKNVGSPGPGLCHRLRRRACLPCGRHPGRAPGPGRVRPAHRRARVACLQGATAGRRMGHPPFLHNGSVPTIYQLLSPQDERSTTFYKGTFNYDPRHLGFETTAFKNAFLFDTKITGNHNSGHEFRAGERGNGVIGRGLLPQERWALLEYLKVLGGPLEQQLP